MTVRDMPSKKVASPVVRDCLLFHGRADGDWWTPLLLLSPKGASLSSDLVLDAMVEGEGDEGASITVLSSIAC